MRHSNRVTQADIDALEKAAHAAYEDDDREHYDALRKAALFKKRQLREQEAGVENHIVTFMDAAE